MKINIREDVKLFGVTKYTLKEIAQAIYSKLQLTPQAASAEEANKLVADTINSKTIAEQVRNGAIDSYNVIKKNKVFYFKEAPASMLEECSKEDAIALYTHDVEKAIKIDRFDWKALDNVDSDKHSFGAYSCSLREHLSDVHVKGLAHCRDIKRDIISHISALHRAACGFKPEEDGLEDFKKAMIGNVTSLESNRQKAIKAGLSKSMQAEMEKMVASTPAWLKK